jgi:glycosyltransferase involved in cell wall biosynthesis
VRRVGLFLDAAFRRDSFEGEIRLHRGPGAFGFMHFAAAVGGHFDRFAVIARETDDVTEAPNPLPPGLELIPLPHYPSLRQVVRVLAAAPATLGAMWRALAGLEAVWVTGVHPIGLMLACMGILRRKRVVLLIRQDSPRYFKYRLSGPGGALAWGPILALDWAFRTLARRLPTTVVGADVARHYRAPRPNVLEMHINLLHHADLADGPSRADWTGPVQLLTVGRIDREKNPMMVVRALKELERRAPGRFSLSWVGDGPLAEELSAEAVRQGVTDSLTLAGYIPIGPKLLERYRSSHAFVHVALTEGVPQVLYEAMGSGLPIVATDVGGVAEALEWGRAGLVIPPEDPGSLAAAIERLSGDADLRDRLAGHALELAAMVTIESESARVAAFIRGDAGAASARSLAGR